jgi:cbb3-type cytochrome oxidase maturation protein
MSILGALIPISLFLGGLGLAAFVWCLRSRQFDDLEGDQYRALFHDDEPT